MSKSSLFYLLLVCIISGRTDSSNHQSGKTYMTYVDRVQIALEKVIGFFAANYRDINLDGVFGLRVAEGALRKALEEAKSGVIHIDAGIKRKIIILKHKANSAAEKAIPFLRNENPVYFQEFKKTIIAPWPNFKPFQKLDHTEIPMPSLQKKDFIEFNEHNSDHCLTEISGTKTGSNSSKPCAISDDCWKLETEGKTHGYALTHQGLYLLLGEVQGCKKEINKRLRQSHIKGGISKVYSRLCATMYPQMTHMEKKNVGLYSFPEDRDLYMEQAMVCGTMGFSDFLSIKRLHDILSWQMDNGCFGSLEELKNKKLQKVVSDEVQSLKSTQEELDKGRLSRKLMSKMTMRKILVEKELKNGCMSHITGVATGLLGVYLRWLLWSVSAEQKVSDPVLAHEQHIDHLVEDPNLAPRHVQMKYMGRRAVLQDKQIAMQVLDAKLKKQSTRNLSWSVVILITAVLVWLVTIRLKLLRRVCLRKATRSVKSYFKV